MCLGRCLSLSVIFDACASRERERGREGAAEKQRGKEAERGTGRGEKKKTLKFHKADSRKRSKMRLRTSSVSRFSVRASCTRHTPHGTPAAHELMIASDDAAP